ncbi:MAG: hypothetical protein IPL84_03285 [Chitinophagaceae bacterium]|nr:hypothetical protein [Chitinophagaceae bacterium]
MKKTIIKNTAVIIFSFISFAALAQKNDQKPKIDESYKNTEQDKTQAPAAAPQIVATPKAMTIDVQPKPIIPGGELIPMETRPVPPIVTAIQEPVHMQPVSLQGPVKAGPPPVVTDMNTAPRVITSPVPQKLILPKEQ